ncbi:50S ribosomal protein L11 methyltransferase [Bacteriovoracaceae bacterium]|nr:50S ribosomal protein L11 methyltransferase [Bacteriovoracaceae bacterium]
MMDNSSYSFHVKKLPKIIVDDLTLEKLNKLNCIGVKELDIEEDVVDEILGDKSYCGGEISDEILNLVDAYIESNLEYEFFLKEKVEDEVTFINNLFSGYEHLLKDFREAGSISLCELEDNDWNEEWKKNYHPLSVTEHLSVIPSFYKGSVEDDNLKKRKIYINPGLGFGTGTHPTTNLCLEYIDNTFSLIEGMRIIDYGCGSGILGLYFLKYAKDVQVDLFDIDKDALENARDNLSLNELNSTNVFDIYFEVNKFLNNKYDLILANILLPVLKDELSTFMQILKPNGVIVLSGILEEQVEELLSFYQEFIEKKKFKIHRSSKEGWVCLVLGNEL